MTEDVFKCVDQHFKDNGSTFWNCQPCATYAKGITARLREMEGRLEAVEKNQEEQDEKIEGVEKKVSIINRALQKRDERVEEIVVNKEKFLYEEIREREMRKKNVILHGVGELQAEKPTWEERARWDKQSCVNIFAAIELEISEDAIKFTKRIGERGEEPRPLLTGFYTEAEKVLVLKNAKKLDNTRYKNVNIAPDMTKRQREEEKELKKTAEERNRNLPETDLAKNLHWTVVGARGERRIEKRLRETTERGGGHRRGGTEARGRRPGPLTGSNRTVLAPRKTKDTVREQDTERDEDENSGMETGRSRRWREKRWRQKRDRSRPRGRRAAEEAAPTVLRKSAKYSLSKCSEHSEDGGRAELCGGHVKTGHHILVTESWCNGDISDAYLSLDGYELIPDLRMDRENTAGGRGGGLLVYAKNGLKVLKLDKVTEFDQ
jgi:hypothetical protein